MTLSDTENKCAMANLKDRVTLKLHFETNYHQIPLFKMSRYVKALVIDFFFRLRLHFKLNGSKFWSRKLQVSEFIFYKWMLSKM